MFVAGGSEKVQEVWLWQDESAVGGIGFENDGGDSLGSLSFLGLGVPPEIPTWGGMLADGRAYISTAWWLALFPGLCIFFTVLGINLLGDGMRDIFDPRLKRSGTGMG